MEEDKIIDLMKKKGIKIVNRIKEFITRLVVDTDAIIDQNQLDNFVNDFFDAGAFE